MSKLYLRFTFLTPNKFYKFCSTLVLALVALLFTCTPTFAASYFMSPTGNDINAVGTESDPFLSITKAQSVASSGDTVYIRGGTYNNFTIANTDSNYNYMHDITKSGITYEAYAKEKPVFNFAGTTTEKRVCAFRIADMVSNVTFRGFEVIGVPVGSQKQSECFRIIGNANFDQVACHDNEANGFYFTTRGSGTCINCDSYNNIGPTSASIGNTDGFGAHAKAVIFSHCRSWNNSDDGYDCLSCDEPMTFDHCWAYNMTAGGDSNGFKIGGFTYNIITDPNFVLPVHNVRYSLSANNNGHGFYANHQPGQAATWTYNTAYNNKQGNFDSLERVSLTDINNIPGYREVLHYNTSYDSIHDDLLNGIRDDNNSVENTTNNSWTIAGITVTDADFESVDASQMTSPRNLDGTLPTIGFMRPVKGSPLNNLGYTTQVADSNDASLSQITVNGIGLSGFKSESKSYTVELPVGTTTVPVVTATSTTNSALSTAVSQASTVTEAATIIVTAQNGTLERYIVNFTIPTAATVAAKITSIVAPKKDATSLTLPTVPEGFTISIKSVTSGASIALDGTITPPTENATVAVVFAITNTADSTIVDTKSINVVVPAKTVVITALSKAITMAETLYDSAEKWTGNGNAVGIKAKLQSAITHAKVVLTNAATTSQRDIDAEVTALNAAAEKLGKHYVIDTIKDNYMVTMQHYGHINWNTFSSFFK